MQTHQQVWKKIQQHKMGRFVVKTSVALVLALVFVGTTFSLNLTRVHARAACVRSNHTYNVVWGDTLSGIAARYRTTYQRLASYNHIADPNLIYVNQRICIPGTGLVSKSPVSRSHKPTPLPVSRSHKPTPPPTVHGAPVKTVTLPTGSSNVFPYPWCTWWADQRYYQVHGVFVPWTTNAEAWEWTARAYQFGWHVSSTPTVGSIIDLQPWVEGAYGGGHVAFVEQVLSNGSVVASNTSWGADPYQVTYVMFTPGLGVTFISQ